MTPDQVGAGKIAQFILDLFRPLYRPLLTEVRTLRRQRWPTRSEITFKVLEDEIEHARRYYHRRHSPPPRRTYPHSPGQLQLEPIHRDVYTAARREEMDRHKAAALVRKLRGLRIYLSFSQERLWPVYLDVLRDLSHSANLREARNRFPDTHSPTQRSAGGY